MEFIIDWLVNRNWFHFNYKFVTFFCLFRKMHRNIYSSQPYKNLRTFPCFKCSYQTTNLKDYNRHLKTHMTNFLFVCTKCRYQTCQRKRFDKHIRKHKLLDEQSKFKSPVPLFHHHMITSNFRHKPHVANHSPTPEFKVPRIPRKIRKITYHCTQCPYTTWSNLDFRSHWIIHQLPVEQQKSEEQTNTNVEG